MNSNIVNIIKIISYLPLWLFNKIKSLFRRKSESKEVLVIALNRLGDTIFLSFTLDKLIELYGDSITILCYSNSEILLKLKHPQIKFITIKSKDVYKGRFVNKGVIKKINFLNAGTIFDLTGSILSAYILLFSNAKKIIGFNEKFFKYLYTDYIEPDNKPHLIDQYSKPLLKEFPGIKINKEFEVSFNPADKILIFPFAGWEAKTWNFDKFINLHSKIIKDFNCKIISERNMIKEEIIQDNPDDFILTDSVEDLIKELRECSLFISNDSGPLYIANMLGKPTFTIYGPTNPLFSLPFGNYHRYIQSKVQCLPKENNQYCHTDAGRKGCNKFICMDELSIDTVYKEVMNFSKYLNLLEKKAITV